MRHLCLILPLVLLTSCSPTECPFKDKFNTTEPTLQSAEDANTKEFTGESFK